RRLPNAHEDGAIPAGDVLCGNASRPSPVEPGPDAESDERVAGTKASGRGLVLSVPPEQLELIQRVRSCHPPTVDRLRPRFPRCLRGEERAEPSQRGPVSTTTPVVLDPRGDEPLDSVRVEDDLPVQWHPLRDALSGDLDEHP